MQLIFTKGSGKYDRMDVVRDDVVAGTIQCPKQGIIPHDMVHYAVESVLAHRGFLGLVADGEAADFRTAGGDPEESVERLVECFQAEMWGERVPAEELLETYAVAGEARGHALAPVSTDDVVTIRARLDELSKQWAAVPVNGSLTLEL